jgi:DNA-binding SARP family transcriptional activator
MFLVLDDVHLLHQASGSTGDLARSPEPLLILDWLIGRAPPDLHVLLSTRYPPRLPNAVTWRVRGELLEIGQRELAFTSSEVASLFRDQYRVFLTPEEVDELTTRTEGWAIALQLVWQGLRTGMASGLPQALRGIDGVPGLSDSDRAKGAAAELQEDFFTFLAAEVLEQQPPDIQEFLLTTAVLREMTAPICDCLRSKTEGGDLGAQVISHVDPRSSGRDGAVRSDRGMPPIPEEPSPKGCSKSRSKSQARRASNRLTGQADSGQILDYLLESGLFVVDLGADDRFGRLVRYHHLFRDFLCHQLEPSRRRALHEKAAACCRRYGAEEEAVHHLLAAGGPGMRAFERAASLLDRMGRKMVRAGRLDTLAGWIGSLPPDVLEAHPSLLVYLGDIARLHSRFDEALGWYRQAETQSRARNDASAISRALRGQARVYLDTVNPTQAEHLLQEALKLSDGQEDRATRARLLELMAENQLNLGHPDRAETLRSTARELREEGPGEAELGIRVLLRTGQLNKARRLLGERLEDERLKPVLRPRAHRETLLLLSLIRAFQGDGEEAYRCAVEGTARGEDLGSPYVTAVGHMRQGHAWLLRDSGPVYEQACQNYQEAIRLGNSLAVPRLKVEAFWGLCRAHGFEGEVSAAERAAQQGIAIAEPAGDEWIAALIGLSLSVAYVLIERHDSAMQGLSQALTAFRECGDTFGEAVARLWQCLVWWQRRDQARLARGTDELLRLARQHGYDYLFKRQTLLGPPDPRRVVPLLMVARRDGPHRAYAEMLLQELGLGDLEIHPGYQLRVQTLGPFRVWRGEEEIVADAWQREKARHLFQFFITHRSRLLDRDQIVEMMWPGLDVETGRRDFKVALSTLRHVLEPNREPGTPSAYVARDGSRYGLRRGADVWIDAQRFEELVEAGDEAFDQDPEAATVCYQEALSVYQDDYLQDCLYEDWCSEERERLLTLYLRTADRVVQAWVEREAWEKVIPACQAILERDDCWEQAYRSMMTAYAEMGYRVQALRTYQRCARTLQETLGIEPSRATKTIHESIR